MQPEYWPQIHGPLQGPALMELQELSPSLAPFCRRTTQLSHADFICHATPGCASIEATHLAVGHASGSSLSNLHCACADDADSSVQRLLSL